MKRKRTRRRPKRRRPKLKALRKMILKEGHLSSHDIKYLNKYLDKIWEHVAETNDRLQDLEIQTNLISRLIATLASEKMGMRSFGLMRMIKKVEKQAIRDNQIADLEKLYDLDYPGKRSRKRRRRS